MTNEDFIKAKACYCTKCLSWYFVSGTCNCYKEPAVTITTSPNSTTTTYAKYCLKCGQYYFGNTHDCNSTFVWKYPDNG